MALGKNAGKSKRWIKFLHRNPDYMATTHKTQRRVIRYIKHLRTRRERLEAKEQIREGMSHA